jgi:4-oxalocrotonate tautomerase
VKKMPWITIQWFEGRDYETKKKVAKLVTEALCVGCGCSSEAVSVVFKDISKKNWAHGGKMYSEK